MRHINMPNDYHVWNAIPERYQRHTPKLTNIMPSKGLFCRRYEIINFAILYHFAIDFDRLLLQLVGNNIVHTLFKCRATCSYRQLIFIIETFQLLMKSCAKFDS